MLHVTSTIGRRGCSSKKKRTRRSNLETLEEREDSTPRDEARSKRSSRKKRSKEETDEEEEGMHSLRCGALKYDRKGVPASGHVKSDQKARLLLLPRYPVSVLVTERP